MKTLSTALALSSVLFAGTAFAGGGYERYTYGATAYPTPAQTVTYGGSVDLGPIDRVQPHLNHTQGQAYIPPRQAYPAPVAATTYTYAAPAPNYNYAPPVVVYPQPAYPAPVYAPQPVYDATAQVRKRLKRQRNRIERAAERGELIPREYDRLRNKLRNIRRDFRDMRNNDGRVGPGEEARLMDRLDRNSRRIARLAHNDRVVRDAAYDPYRRY